MIIAIIIGFISRVDGGSFLPLALLIFSAVTFSAVFDDAQLAVFVD